MNEDRPSSGSAQRTWIERISQVLLSETGRAFAIASLAVGFILAWCAYALSAVSLPMLIDWNTVSVLLRRE